MWDEREKVGSEREWMATTFHAVAPRRPTFGTSELLRSPSGGVGRVGEFGSGWPQLSEQLLRAGLLSVLLNF